MAKKIATRTAYGEALATLTEEYPELVVLDADLSGSTTTKGSAKTHPDRFYNMSTAEANMTGVAAGLAACGKKPFTSTFAMFAAGRAWEQVHNSIAYPWLNVRTVGSHGDLSVGEGGATHRCIGDYTIMRATPSMMVVSPCDGPEMRQAVRTPLDYDGFAYLRLGHLAVENVTDTIPSYIFHLSQDVTLRDGSDAVVIATGMMVQMALKATERLTEEGLSARVLDMHTIRLPDGELALKAVLGTGAIITTEETSVVGGLGSAVAEFLAEHYPVSVVRHGVNDVFGHSGKAEVILEAYGLTLGGIAEKMRHAVERRK